jgi:hypothetical protein
MRSLRLVFAAILIISGQAGLLEATSPSLEEVSEKVNKKLPEIYDPITKLIKTSIINNSFYYHFLVGATRLEYKQAESKVRAQIKKTICSKSFERAILLEHKANIVYQYETPNGESLGQFMIKPEHCHRK